MLLVVVLVIQLIGCAYSYDFKTGRTASGHRESVWIHQGLYGHLSDNEVDLEALCPGGVAEFGSKITVFNWLPALMTIGMYTPRTAWAICASDGGGK
jgi:hypothetical protein